MDGQEFTLYLAQLAPGIDPSSWMTLGPLGVVCGGLLWYLGRLQDKIDKINNETIPALVNAHKIEIAAERSLNAKLQEQRLEDQKVLIPLSHSMVTALEMNTEAKK